MAIRHNVWDSNSYWRYNLFNDVTREHLWIMKLYRPIKYIIDKDKLVIKRPFKDLTLDIKKIKDAFLTKKESMRWTIRTFGNGGLFGYFGQFNNETFGDMTWYATKRNNYTIIETIDNEKIILTPDDTEMVKELRKLIRK
jgi:hypothetical protein